MSATDYSRRDGRRTTYENPLHGLSQREPPSNIQAEHALLGACLANNAAFQAVVGFLRPEHFSDPINGKVYREIGRGVLKGNVVDAVTLKAILENAGILDEVGGVDYLTRLLSSMVGIAVASEYGRAIHDCAVRRSIIEICGESIELAFGTDPDLDGEGVIQKLTDQVMDLSARGSKDVPEVAIGAAARLAIRAAEAEARGEVSNVVYSGLKPLDDAIGGFRGGWLYILGGRPGSGKSSLCVQASIGTARALRKEAEDAPAFSGAGGVVLFFSAEMPVEQVGGWAACHIAGIGNDVLSGERHMTEYEAAAFLAAQRELDTLPIRIIDAVGMSGPAIALRTRAVNQKHRVRLVIIDHIQKLVSSTEDSRKGAPDRTGDTAKITGSLKDLARKINAPVVALAQLKRDVEMRDNPRPRLSDLMFSGEADADVAAFLFREELYLSRQPPEMFPREKDEMYAKRKDAWHRKWDAARNRAELLTCKRRQGPLSEVRMAFDGSVSRFSPLSPAVGDEPPVGLWDDE